MQHPYGVQRYRETNLSTMTKEKMIVLLYEKIISDLEQAQQALEVADRVEMTRLVNHSQRIVSELRGALDHSIGGDISRNLESLYDFLFHEHLQVIVDLDPIHFVNAIRVVTPLLEAWRQVPHGTGAQAQREAQQQAQDGQPGLIPASQDPEASSQKPNQQDKSPVTATEPRNLLSVTA